MPALSLAYTVISPRVTTDGVLSIAASTSAASLFIATTGATEIALLEAEVLTSSESAEFLISA